MFFVFWPVYAWKRLKNPVFWLLFLTLFFFLFSVVFCFFYLRSISGCFGFFLGCFSSGPSFWRPAAVIWCANPLVLKFFFFRFAFSAFSVLFLCLLWVFRPSPGSIFFLGPLPFKTALNPVFWLLFFALWLFFFFFLWFFGSFLCRLFRSPKLSLSSWGEFPASCGEEWLTGHGLTNRPGEPILSLLIRCIEKIAVSSIQRIIYQRKFRWETSDIRTRSSHKVRVVWSKTSVK